MVLQLLACLRPAGITGTEMGVAIDHHIFKQKWEKEKGKASKFHIVLQTEDLLLTSTREMSQLWIASHPR